MAGLLDYLGTPEGQGLLSAAFGGLAGARRGAPLNSIGGAGLAGLSGYVGAQQRGLEQSRYDMQNKLSAIQLQQAQQQQSDTQAERQLARDSFQTSGDMAVSQNGGPNLAASNAQPTTSPGMNMNKYSTGLWAINPDKAAQFAVQQNAMRPKFKEFTQGIDQTTNKLVNYSVNEFGTATPTAFAPKPSIKLANLGGTMQAYDENSLTPGATFKATASPDAILSANTSTSNNRATISKDLTVAGITTDGSVNQNVETMAQAIARGAAAPITGFALAKPQGQTVMRRVFELNPSYDETTYSAKMKGAKDFSTGSQGNAMRSFAVAGQHLDQLGGLVDALDNGNIQLVNKIANSFATQTGGTAPTNFDAAKDIVSKEVVKAIVAGGGGVSEREELARLMSQAKSPAQLKGVISQYRSLMGAQHDALLQQRRAAGLPDSTLPNYGGDSTHPPEINGLLQKYGK